MEMSSEQQQEQHVPAEESGEAVAISAADGATVTDGGLTVNDDILINNIIMHNNDDDGDNDVNLNDDNVAGESSNTTSSNNNNNNNKKRKRCESSTAGTGGKGAAPSTSTSTSTSTQQRRRRDPRAPKSPRTALELYQLDAKRQYLQKHASLPKDFITRKSIEFEKLSFHKQQQWKVAEAEDLLRYQRAIAQYKSPPGYDPYGNLLPSFEGNEGGEEGQAGDDYNDNDNENVGGPSNKLPKMERDPSLQQQQQAPAPGLQPSIITTPDGTTAVSTTAVKTSHHLTLATASFSDMVYELYKYKMIHKHARVPIKKGGILGKWIDKLRKEHKKYKGVVSGSSAGSSSPTYNGGPTTSSLALHDNLRLDQERIQVLTHLGMAWEFPNEDYEEIWQNHFRQLVQFKEENGYVRRFICFVCACVYVCMYVCVLEDLGVVSSRYIIHG
jgi:hypothetical protein